MGGRDFIVYTCFGDVLPEASHTDLLPKSRETTRQPESGAKCPDAFMGGKMGCFLLRGTVPPPIS